MAGAVMIAGDADRAHRQLRVERRRQKIEVDIAGGRRASAAVTDDWRRRRCRAGLLRVDRLARTVPKIDWHTANQII
jgi:hypothetical protein